MIIPDRHDSSKDTENLKRDYETLAGQMEQFHEQLGLLIGENINLKKLVTSLESKYTTLFKSTQDEKLKMRTTMASLEQKYLVLHNAVVNQSDVVNSKSIVKLFTNLSCFIVLLCLCLFVSIWNFNDSVWNFYI